MTRTFVRLQGYIRNVYMVTLTLAKPLQFAPESPIDSVRSSSEHSEKGLNVNLASKGRKTLLATETTNYYRRWLDVKFSILTSSKFLLSGSAGIPAISSNQEEPPKHQPSGAHVGENAYLVWPILTRNIGFLPRFLQNTWLLNRRNDRVPAACVSG